MGRRHATLTACASVFLVIGGIAAALLFDLRDFDLHEDLLRKLARLSVTAHSEDNSSTKNDCDALARLCRVLPLIINTEGKTLKEIPMESRIVELAETFDSLTHDADMRTALPPSVARNVIVRGSGTKFDPEIVGAFIAAYDKGKIVFLLPTEIEVK